jgi:FkbM family methyltransferase
VNPSLPNIRDSLIDAAIRFRVDRPLLRLRAIASRRHRPYWHEHEELRRVLARVLTPTSNCVDVGAYNGRALAEMVRLAPRGRHIAFEPLPHKYRLLSRRFPGVDVRHGAVSNERGEATFTIVHDAAALSGLRNRWEGETTHQTTSVTVPVATLDTDLPADYVPHFIKIDVEGAERLVFEGAMETIRTHKPTILFEHGKGGADHYDTKPGDIYALLVETAGLRLYTPESDAPLSLDEFERLYEENEQWDFLARA